MLKVVVESFFWRSADSNTLTMTVDLFHGPNTSDDARSTISYVWVRRVLQLEYRARRSLCLKA
jgi:hypothetical protein